MNEKLREALGLALQYVPAESKDPLEQEEIDKIHLLVKEGTEAIPIEPPVMQKIAEVVEKYGLECPNSNNCNNKGTLAEHGCDGSEEDCARTCPVPVQCEFCYCEPRSKFNLENDLKEKFASNFTA